MTTPQTIPLNLLVPSKANVRRTGKQDGIGELVASIAAHGLRQNLNVVATASGRYEVVAGARRLRALKQLAKVGQLAKDAPIPCLVLGEGDNPAEISLVENTLRVAMHPDDQCNAFRSLIDKGASVEDVAARFGITPAVVTRRVRLANVSPRLRALFRDGEIGLDQMMAFAVVDDHAAQEAAWHDLPDWSRDADDIRAHLTRETVPLTDKLARFVGEEAYLAAGGGVLRDLFAEEGHAYLSDRALLTRLAADKLAQAVEAVQAEGWKWVIAEAQPDYSTHYSRLHPQADEDDEGDAPATFTPEDKARAGARLRIDHRGELEIDRGLIHPKDREDGAPSPSPGQPPRDAGALAASMVEELTMHRTAALRIELARNPAVALAATVHALAVAVLYPACPLPASSLTLRATSKGLERVGDARADSAAHAAMDDMETHWLGLLPEDPADLFPWCLAQQQETLLDLLAFVAALSVDAVRGKQERPDTARLTHADQLAAALGLDMRHWWTPSVDGFFARLTKAQMVQAVTEARAPLQVNLGGLKKADAARYVGKAMHGTGWLPQPLHTPQVA